MSNHKNIPNTSLGVMLWLLWVWCGVARAQTGNYVPSGAEATNFGTINLSTSTNWATDRSASPGFFAANGTATYINASDASNINGYVKHYVQAANQGFTFPVGTGTDLRLLTTGGTIPSGINMATAWIVGNPSSVNDPTAPSSGAHSVTMVGTGIGAVSTAGQWDWLVNNGAGSAAGVTVTVSIPDMSSFAASAADLRLVGWNGTQWVNLSGSTGASGLTQDNTLSGTMQAGITAIGIGLGCTTTVPTLSYGNITNSCPVTTVNLNTLVTNTAPGSYSLTWYTSASGVGTPVSSPTAASGGVYYAFYQNAVSGCSSPASASVLATVTSCVPVGAGTINCSKTQLTPSPVAGTPSQVGLVVTVNVTTAGTFPLTVSGSGMTLANSITTVSTTTTGLQQFFIPLRYDGTALGILNFTVGAAGSCSADLTTPPKKGVIDVWTLDCIATVGPALR